MTQTGISAIELVKRLREAPTDLEIRYLRYLREQLEEPIADGELPRTRQSAFLAIRSAKGKLEAARSPLREPDPTDDQLHELKALARRLHVATPSPATRGDVEEQLHRLRRQVDQPRLGRRQREILDCLGRHPGVWLTIEGGNAPDDPDEYVPTTRSEQSAIQRSLRSLEAKGLIDVRLRPRESTLLGPAPAQLQARLRENVAHGLTKDNKHPEKTHTSVMLTSGQRASIMPVQRSGARGGCTPGRPVNPYREESTWQA
jgi:hypothetical protein